MRGVGTLLQFRDHANIVSVVNFFKANGSGNIVMEYLHGVTLQEYLKQQLGGRLSLDQPCVFWFRSRMPSAQSTRQVLRIATSVQTISTCAVQGASNCWISAQPGTLFETKRAASN